MKKVFVICAIFLLIFIMSGYAKALCVKTPAANLRSGPGTKYEKTWEVFKYMPFKKLRKKGNWYKIRDFEGDIHWIYRNLVTDKFKCAVIKIDKANIRTGPGKRYANAVMSPGLMYHSFKVLKKSGSWVKVIDEFGDSGWIFRKLLWIY